MHTLSSHHHPVVRVGLLLLAGLGLAFPLNAQTLDAAPPGDIVCDAEASWAELLAAREVRRYVYLRTGQLLPIRTATNLPPDAAILIARRDRPILNPLRARPGLGAALAELDAQHHWLTVATNRAIPLQLLCGGDDAGVLYAAYRFAERLGVRFYLHGDVLPDELLRGPLPAINERAAPLFTLRGLLPFHDFPEGPDWWNQDDYLAVISQVPKLRMNFIGLHTYPEGGPNAEPTVWIGPPSDIGAGVEVKASYPASYQSTRRGNWGYTAQRTSGFVFGSAALFEHDDFGADVMAGFMPEPPTGDAGNALFARTAMMLRTAFKHAHRLGVQTCVGTEVPLTVPGAVAERLRQQGKDPANPAVVGELYEGIFRRAAQAYPLDYYWLWTPEGWTWSGTTLEQARASAVDLQIAIQAARNVGAPFRLATCGWVIGPQQDRLLYHKLAPPDVAISCINRTGGNTPVEQEFGDITGRSKWAIPWLQDDHALTTPQLWVGRMRRDARDARRYGCNGLIGQSWHTRSVAPGVGAQAQAAWDQSAWNLNPVFGETPRVAGALGGQPLVTTNAIADTSEAPLYQTLREGVTAYHLPLSNGLYRVTLKFCEPHATRKSQRVFDLKVQRQLVIGSLDVFAVAGQNRVADFTFDHVDVTDGWLDIRFVPVVGRPAIAAIEVTGEHGAWRINCGGPAWKDYVADWPASPFVPEIPATTDFFQDWALHEFGPEVAAPAAKLFEQVDGRMPRPADWDTGPGGLEPDGRSWAETRVDYAFVDEFAALRPRVKGAGQRERFDFWLNQLESMRRMAEVACQWTALTNAMGAVLVETNRARQRRLVAERVQPLRVQLEAQLERVFESLFATVTTPGELGTVANWNQHLLPNMLGRLQAQLADIEQGRVPVTNEPAIAAPTASLFTSNKARQAYRGPTRIIVPTLRSSLNSGETLNLKVIILGERPPKEAKLFVRPLGRGEFVGTPLTHVARGVYRVHLASPAEATDLEYFIRVVPTEGAPVHYPATAPKLNQTLVVLPEEPGDK
jgi:hypothetical protein